MCLQGRIRELEEIRAELAEKELVLLGKEQELLERDQSVQVLREEASLRIISISHASPRHWVLSSDDGAVSDSRMPWRLDLHLVVSSCTAGSRDV